MKKNIKRVLAFTLTAAALLGAAGCGGSSKTAAQSGTAESASADSPRQVLIGIRQDLFPTSYIDEKGEPQGYDIDIIKKIDEKLPQYEFTYEAVSQEALLTGLESGKYAAAVAGFYTSDERQEKYLFPQEPIGGNLIGLEQAGKNRFVSEIIAHPDLYKHVAETAKYCVDHGYGKKLLAKYAEHEEADKK